MPMDLEEERIVDDLHARGWDERGPRDKRGSWRGSVSAREEEYNATQFKMATDKYRHGQRHSEGSCGHAVVASGVLRA